MDFNSFNISGNRNDCPLQISCLLMYFICDVNMTSLYFQQDSVPAHRARDAIELLRRTTSDFVAPDPWFAVFSGS